MLSQTTKTFLAEEVSSYSSFVLNLMKMKLVSLIWNQVLRPLLRFDRIKLFLTLVHVFRFLGASSLFVEIVISLFSSYWWDWKFSCFAFNAEALGNCILSSFWNDSFLSNKVMFCICDVTEYGFDQFSAKVVVCSDFNDFVCHLDDQKIFFGLISNVTRNTRGNIDCTCIPDQNHTNIKSDGQACKLWVVNSCKLYLKCQLPLNVPIILLFLELSCSAALLFLQARSQL